MGKKDVVFEVVRTVGFMVENYLGSMWDSMNNRGRVGARISLTEDERVELQEVLESYLGEELVYYLNRARELDYVRLESICKDVYQMVWDHEEEIYSNYGGTWIGLALEDIQFLAGEINRSVNTVCDLVMVLQPDIVKRYGVNLIQEMLAEVRS